MPPAQCEQLAASASNTPGPMFYPALVAVLAWALWSARPRRYPLVLWLALLAAAAGTGYGLQGGLHRLQGWMRVATSGTFGRMELLPLVRRFQAQHPGVKVDLQLHDGFIDLIEQGIESGKISFRILSCRSFPVARILKKVLLLTLGRFLFCLPACFSFRGG